MRSIPKATKSQISLYHKHFRIAIFFIISDSDKNDTVPIGHGCSIGTVSKRKLEESEGKKSIISGAYHSALVNGLQNLSNPWH